MPRTGRSLGGCVLLIVVNLVSSQKQICQVAEAISSSVDAHLDDWDSQLEQGLDPKQNCSSFLEFVYFSRERIRTQLSYIQGNFSAEDQAFIARGENGLSTPYAMTHMSTAASLISAHIHVHGVFAAARTDCLSEQLQLLFLMSLRRLKTLLHGQLRHLWVVFQGTSELFRQGVARWLDDVMELFDADMRTMDSVMSTWRPPDDELREAVKSGLVDTKRHRAVRPGTQDGSNCVDDLQTISEAMSLAVQCCDSAGATSRPGCLSNSNFTQAKEHCEKSSLTLCRFEHAASAPASATGSGCTFDDSVLWTSEPCLPGLGPGNVSLSPPRPGPPLPAFTAREPDGVGLSTLEVLRRDAFDEWEDRKPLLRGLLRHVIPRDAHIADLCAGSGSAAEFLNETGLVTAYAFDASSNIGLLSKGLVEYLRPHAERLELWRSFDLVLCLPAAEYFGADVLAWNQVWRNIEAHAGKGAVLSCGIDEVRRVALAAAAAHAPSLRLDNSLSAQLSGAMGGLDSTCVFWRQT